MTDPGPRSRWLPLAGFIASALAAGGLGAWATSRNVRIWYPLLHKPAWNPPAWLFGPVWTVLYILMGVSAWRAWRIRLPAGRAIVAVYFVQLAVNASWSVLFFGLRQPAWALADIAVLWALLAWIQASLARADRLAAWLWLPYLLWVSFASVLNFAIVRLN
jgi:tryptophan-rich sensory protein